MKTIGLIGGMSWESTATYYRLLNERVKKTLGGFHSAKLMLASVDFFEIEQFQAADAWDESGEMLGALATKLEGAGAEAVALCTNTMHIVADRIARDLTVPFLHICDATSRAVKAFELQKVLLLGTRYTMERDFMREKMSQAGLEVLVPEASDIEIINNVIFDELVQGKILESSRAELSNIIAWAAAKGAEGVVLGCTELGLLVTKSDLPIIDTTVAHAEAIAGFALGD